MIKNQRVKKYWERFKTVSGVDDSQFGEAYEFGNTDKMADELADLVNRGIKTATTSALDLYEPNESIPAVGNYDIILDSNQQPICITRTEVVETIPFDQVSAEHAYHEGEGDRSLAYWRKVHVAFFKQTYQEENQVFHNQIPCVCEVFKVVYH